MPPEIVNCEQNSPEWFEARRGIPTASKFKDILAKGEGKMRRSYMLRLAGEIVTGEVTEGYSNSAMERGHEMEPVARANYAFSRGVEPERIGFIRNGEKGCSPDSLIGANGGLEIKTAEPHILIDKILHDTFPPEHKAQVQGFLWVAEREWCDLAIYWPKMPLFVVRAYRDAGYIKTLAEEVNRFTEELADVVERVRSYSGNPREDARSMFERSLAS